MPVTRTITIRLSQQTLERLHAEADRSGTKPATWVRRLVERALKRSAKAK
jgi:predicted DNA-binding protein